MEEKGRKNAGLPCINDGNALLTGSVLNSSQMARAIQRGVAEVMGSNLSLIVLMYFTPKLEPLYLVI